MKTFIIRICLLRLLGLISGFKRKGNVLYDKSIPFLHFILSFSYFNTDNICKYVY